LKGSRFALMQNCEEHIYAALCGGMEISAKVAFTE
jgi:hypothetical protein